MHTAFDTVETTVFILYKHSFFVYLSFISMYDNVFTLLYSKSPKSL